MFEKLSTVSPSNVMFLEMIRRAKYTAIYVVSINGTKYAIKVYRRRQRSEWDDPNYEVDLFNREVSAYGRLKVKGVCDSGHIPDFYGAIENIQIAQWAPPLDIFHTEQIPPAAIFMEYIPNMHRLDLSTYSHQRTEILGNILKEIHAAHVVHGDTKPRNMMIVPGENERVLWIDFDFADVLPEGPLSERHEIWLREEAGYANDVFELLAEDYERGDGQLKSARMVYNS